uniref:hypothetical protein n=1 Tax=uncultured Sphingomonas sp. TaxID=158754 RepID=UPI0035CBF240
MPIQVIVHTAAQGPDTTAWVAAGAAVIQALGAIAAIYYSGKLARDAAKREIAADEANARRISEANLAAIERRRLAREEAIRDFDQEEVRRFNEPLDLAIKIAESALQELVEQYERTLEKLARGDLDFYIVSPGPAQELLIERLPAIVDAATDADIASATRAIWRSFAPFGQVILTAVDWNAAFAERIPMIKAAIERLRNLRR